MNSRKLEFAPWFTAFFCAVSLATGAVFCMITAFDVPVTGWKLVACLTAVSAVFSYLCGCRRGWIGLVALAVAALVAGFYERLALYASASAAIETISGVYASAFEGLQTISLMPTEASATGTLFFAILGTVLSLITAWTVRGQNTLWLAAVCGALPLVSCLIILQSEPAPWAVLLLVGAIALLLLSQQLRRRSAHAGGVLALRLLPLLCALMLGLYALFPQTDYTRSAWSDALKSGISQAADKLSVFRLNTVTGQVQIVSPFAPSTLGGKVWDSSVTKTDLNRVGPQRMSGQHVMRMYASGGGAYYLRGCSSGVYEDNQWRAVSDADYAAAQIPEDVFLVSGAYEQEQVRIETDMKSSVYYMPYLPTDLPENAAPFYDAYVKNPLQQTEYAVNRAFGNDMQVGENAAAAGGYRDFVYQTYTQIPDGLRAALSSPDVTPVRSWIPTDTYEILELARQIVQDGKSYDLNTPRVPEGEDFVAWFLTESSTGYCVHFATAMTMLLRYYGVPARYVTGYLVDAKAGAWTDVTQDDAHAWVEYYQDGFGWLAFDPTPASVLEDEPPEELNQTDIQPQETKNEPERQEGGDTEQRDDAQPVSDFDETEDHAENNTPQDKPEKSHAGKWLLTAVWCILALAALLFLWRIAVLSARTARLTRGSVNRRAVQYYRHLALLARLDRGEIPDELEALAQRARFSQHKLTEDELQPFIEYTSALTQQVLRQAKPMQRVIYRLFYVLQ